MPKCTICEKENLIIRTFDYFKSNDVDYELVHGNEYQSHVRFGDNVEAIVKHYNQEHPYLKEGFEVV